MSEPLSPFVSWPETALDPELPRRGPSLWTELVRHPEIAVARMLDPRALQRTVLASLAMIVACTAAFGSIVRLDEGAGSALGTALRLAASSVLAIAAALGPIHATSLLVAARVPLARLVAVLLGAVAAGAVVLAPLGPIVRILHQRDAEWLGPLGLVAAFGIAAIVSGGAVHALLRALATASGALSEADAFRVGILARMAVLFLGFTVMLALWGLGAFL